MAKPETEMVKTSLKLPKHLWREAHIRALDEGKELQEIMALALAEYLARKPKGGNR
jgi:hypothetical protein